MLYWYFSYLFYNTILLLVKNWVWICWSDNILPGLKLGTLPKSVPAKFPCSFPRGRLVEHYLSIVAMWLSRLVCQFFLSCETCYARESAQMVIGERGWQNYPLKRCGGH